LEISELECAVTFIKDDKRQATHRYEAVAQRIRQDGVR
jgi:hypothetical protein